MTAERLSMYLVGNFPSLRMWSTHTHTLTALFLMKLKRIFKKHVIKDSEPLFQTGNHLYKTIISKNYQQEVTFVIKD